MRLYADEITQGIHLPLIAPRGRAFSYYLAATGFARREAIGLPDGEMYLRRSRQVPRRAKRGALRSKVARGCARAAKRPQGAERGPQRR